MSRVFGVFDEFADALVRLRRHDEELGDEYERWDNEVYEEEFLEVESAGAVLVQEAVSEEDGTAGVEGAGELGQDKARVAWECVA